MVIEKIEKGAKNPELIVPYLIRKSLDLFFWVTNPVREDKQICINGNNAFFTMRTRPDAWVLNDINEQLVLKDLLSRLRSDDVFWDVGANIGLYSCLASDTGVEVYAFEPDPNARDRLETNFDLNDVTGSVLPIGLAEKSHTLDRELNMQRQNHPTVVKTIPGDKVVRDGLAPAPSVVKIDIEGMELAALRGLSETINGIRLAYVELHPAYLSQREESPNEVVKWFETRGFDVMEVPYDGGHPIVRCVNNNRE